MAEEMAELVKNSLDRAASIVQEANNQEKITDMTDGALFLLSDLVLLFWMFGVQRQEWVQWANWILYYSAQGCLAGALSAGHFRLTIFE